MSGFKLDDAFEAALIADLEPRLERAGEVFKDQLQENVSFGPRSGIHYSDLPNRSSSSREFPQYQFGTLHDSAGNKATNDPLSREVGFFDENLGKLLFLEYGAGGGRAPITRTLEDAHTQRKALEVMGGEP